MKKYHYIVIIPLFFILLKVEAHPTISFFFKPSVDIEALSHKLKKPGNIAKHTIHGIMHNSAMMEHSLIVGIYVTYAGYITASDYEGEVIFPRKHHQAEVTFVITPEISPVITFENMITHWELMPNMPAAMYTCQQKNSEKKHEYFWEMKEVPLPSDNKILPATIIIIAKPQDISMPVGTTPTRDTANLVLPSISVIKGIDLMTNGSYLLTIRHFFKNVDSKLKREPLEILTNIID